MNEKELTALALEARKHAYVPYSGWAVGAALLTEEGRVYTGCNIENAAYTPTICAERTAIFKAVSEGERNFKAIAIVGGKAGEEPNEFCSPCGVCRQVMMEFVSYEEFEIVLGRVEEKSGEVNTKVYSLKTLLPEGFGPSTLGA